MAGSVTPELARRTATVNEEGRGEMHEQMNRQVDEQQVRTRVREAVEGVLPLVTMSRDGLVITALEWGVAREPAYESAAAAVQAGHLELREQGSGTVPSIEAATKARPVVIFAGDTVVGGKQNRIINITVWLPAATVTPIPVSCLEHGRWNQGYRFETSRKVDYALRAQMSAQLADVAAWESGATAGAPTRPRRRSYAADQGRVWNEISAREARIGVRSQTAALHDLYACEAVDVAALAGAIPCPVGATGVAVGIGGQLIAVELFDATATLAEQWPRLVEGAASAYVDHRRAVAAGIVPRETHRYPDEGALGRMLGRAVAATNGAIVGPSVGEGSTSGSPAGRSVVGPSSSATVWSTWSCSGCRRERIERAAS